jgi:hypothetical protein
MDQNGPDIGGEEMQFQQGIQEHDGELIFNLAGRQEFGSRWISPHGLHSRKTTKEHGMPSRLTEGRKLHRSFPRRQTIEKGRMQLKPPRVSKNAIVMTLQQE